MDVLDELENEVILEELNGFLSEAIVSTDQLMDQSILSSDFLIDTSTEERTECSSNDDKTTGSPSDSTPLERMLTKNNTPLRPQKRELLRLRKDAKRLEGQLRGIKRQFGFINSSRASPKAIVSRQRQARNVTEEENSKLRRMLAQQANAISNLSSIYNGSQYAKLKSASVILPLIDRPRSLNSNPPPEHLVKDNEEFTALLAAVDAGYSQLDAKISRIEDAKNVAHGSFFTTRTSYNAKGRRVSELMRCINLPFDLDVASRAAWRMLGDDGIGRLFYMKEPFSVSDNLRAEKVGHMQCEQPTINSFGKRLIRRYVERDRIVVVWKLELRPVHIMGKSVSGVVLERYGWATITPAQEGDQSGSVFRMIMVFQVATEDEERCWSDARLAELYDADDAQGSQIDGLEELMQHLLIEEDMKTTADQVFT